MNENQIKEQILQIINSSTNFITADEIWNQLSRETNPGRTQETIRKYIRDLVNEERNLIGSSNKGYFKITTPEKAIKAISYLENRIPDLQRRANKIRESWNNLHPESQIL